MKNIITALIALLLLTTPDAVGARLQQTDSVASICISGKVIDHKSKRPVANTTVAVDATDIATVTNADGTFSLTFPSRLGGSRIVISNLDYFNETVPVGSWPSDGVIRMRRAPNHLEEVVVYGGDPKVILLKALDRIADNYPRSRHRLSLFYRETLQKGRRYTEVSEGILSAAKSPYPGRYIGDDRVQVLKGRRLLSQKTADTLAVKVAGGPNLSIQLDFVKNPDFFLTEEEIENYDLKLGKSVMLDDRPQYAVHFSPKTKTEYPLMKGVVYIDAELLAFTRAEFEMDMSDRTLVTRAMLRRKPRGLRFSPQKLAFVIAYRRSADGSACLSYVRSTMKFKCDWKRRLFSSTYTAVTEMVVVDRLDAAPQLPRRDAFRQEKAFSDVVTQYWDEDFWKGYNIIEPTESLERAVGRLKR